MGGRKAQWFGMLKDFPADQAGRLVEAAVGADPTPGRAYVAWALRQFKAGEVRLPEDGPALRRLLEAWERAKARGEVPGDRDINRRSYRELAALVERIEPGPSGRQESRRAKQEGAAVVHREGPYRVLEITTPEAAAIYSRGTRWCTSDPEAAAGYLSRGRLFLLFEGGRKLALVHWATGQVRDMLDRPARLPVGLKRLLRRATGKRVGPGREGRMQRLAGLVEASAGHATEGWRKLVRGPSRVSPAAVGLWRLRAAGPWQELVRECYAAHDFVVLGCVLRFFPEADLTAVCLDYLDTDLVRLLFFVFKMPQEVWFEMGARPPLGGRLECRRQREFLGFFSELCRVREGRAGSGE